MADAEMGLSEACNILDDIANAVDTADNGLPIFTGAAMAIRRVLSEFENDSHPSADKVCGHCGLPFNNTERSCTVSENGYHNWLSLCGCTDTATCSLHSKWGWVGDPMGVAPVKPNPVLCAICACPKTKGCKCSLTLCPKCDTVNMIANTKCDFCEYEPKETEIQLLVIDLGDSCVVKVEKGDGLETVSHLAGTKINDSTAHIRHPFERVRAAIDKHFDEKPVPRLERRPEKSTATGADVYLLFNDNPHAEGQGMEQWELNALNTLARQAGATKDLEIWEPKASGTWMQLVKHHDKRLAIGHDDAMGSIDFDNGCDIWRYTRTI